MSCLLRKDPSAYEGIAVTRVFGGPRQRIADILDSRLNDTLMFRSGDQLELFRFEVAEHKEFSAAENWANSSVGVNGTCYALRFEVPDNIKVAELEGIHRQLNQQFPNHENVLADCLYETLHSYMTWLSPALGDALVTSPNIFIQKKYDSVTTKLCHFEVLISTTCGFVFTDTLSHMWGGVLVGLLGHNFEDFYLTNLVKIVRLVTPWETNFTYEQEPLFTMNTTQMLLVYMDTPTMVPMFPELTRIIYEMIKGAPPPRNYNSVYKYLIHLKGHSASWNPVVTTFKYELPYGVEDPNLFCDYCVCDEDDMDDV